MQTIARRLGATETVVEMNRRLGGDVSLIRRSARTATPAVAGLAGSEGVPARVGAGRERGDGQPAQALGAALSVLNDRERRIFEARRLADDPITLEELAEEFGVSARTRASDRVRAFEKGQKAVKNRLAEMESPATVPAH